ncbi:MAG: VWA domain-containing protein [Rickettsiaceae bacterium]|nr:VWA domain-containing protein [Rickettsiaceae bacterium]
MVLEKIKELEEELAKLKSSLVETDIIILLDRSGSMQSNKSDHEGGLRSFVERQKQLVGQTYFSFIQFDDQNPFDLVYDKIPLNDVKELKLDPRGLTPLRDAIGRTINYFNSTKRDVIFLIVSDGQENASKEFSQDQIRKMVLDKKEAGWQFLFVGTNFDVITTGINNGFDLGKNVIYTNNAASIDKAYGVTANKLNAFRSARASGQSVTVSSDCLDFSSEELNEIKEAK